MIKKTVPVLPARVLPVRADSKTREVKPVSKTQARPPMMKKNRKLKKLRKETKRKVVEAKVIALLPVVRGSAKVNQVRDADNRVRAAVGRAVKAPVKVKVTAAVQDKVPGAHKVLREVLNI